MSGVVQLRTSLSQAANAESALHQCVDGVDAIRPPDLLPLVNPARLIADRHLDNPSSREQELRRQLGFEVETYAAKPNPVERVTAKHFVRRFHIGEPCAEQDVGD